MSKNAKQTPEPVSTVPARAIRPKKEYSDEGDDKMKSLKPPFVNKQYVYDFYQYYHK